MNAFRRLLLTSTLPTLAALATAQSPCFPTTSAIQNPGFEAIGSLLYPWNVTGTATYEDGQSVDGRTTSRCLRAESAITATQPVPMNLTSGVQYELGFDALSRYRHTVYYSIQLRDDAGTLVHESASQWTRGVDQRRRVMTAFTPQVTGDYTLTIYSSWLADLDNLYIRRQPIMLTVRDQRAAGADHTLDFFGPANANFAGFLSFGGRLPQGFSLAPLCSGEWWLNGPVFTLASGVLGNDGRFALSLTIPANLAGIPFEFQPLLLPPNCEFGCPSTYEFF